MTLSLRLAFIAACCTLSAFPQDRSNPQPDDRYKADLLVVVAHPDDETALGAYLARAIFDEKKRVAVVYGTRGDGGPNAQGQEEGASLGAVREIEVRRALAHFGVMNVWFLNGPDTPHQDVLRSLETWNHGDSLGRMVRLIRLTRPPVIATWLPDYVAGENHSDHQASSVIANEAFDLAGDASAFGEQLAPPRNREGINNLTEGLHPWQPQKIYFFSDTAHADFLEGKGPVYSAKDTSPSQHKSYGRLAAEECAFHLTQPDSGQEAKAALLKNDLHEFEEPVRFIFGKSLVKSSVTGDLFEGVVPEGVSYQRPPGFIPEKAPQPALALGGPWSFYQKFWQAHGLDHLADLVPPEIEIAYSTVLTIPVVIENPAANDLPVRVSVGVPNKEWTLFNGAGAFSVRARSDYSFHVLAKTPEKKVSGWQMVTIKAESGGKSIGSIPVRIRLDDAAMPQ
ncbi:MAG: PIG-L family deacetylase [Acidobacteriaceae bacterium]|nr:PIG-L family deacetylase [Acidobacteriaceae bacterium]MBV9779889.1 PIG-L family deacetylase [Acidobacteriaceae bacterium]